MNRLLFLHSFLISMLLCNNAISSGPDFTDLLSGNWSCESGPCPDEEIAFSIEDGQQKYASWLHARPAAVDGSWHLEGNNLLIECCSGLRFEFTILGITETELVLLEEGAEDQVILRRIP